MCTTVDLIQQAEDVAKHVTDGHITFFRFTSGWKIFLGTPDLDTGEGRQEILYTPGHYPTLREALIYFLERDITGDE